MAVAFHNEALSYFTAFAWRQELCPAACVLGCLLLLSLFGCWNDGALVVVHCVYILKPIGCRQVARCTKIIDAGQEDAKYVINVRQIAKFVVGLGEKVRSV